MRGEEMRGTVMGGDEVRGTVMRGEKEEIRVKSKIKSDQFFASQSMNICR